MFVEVRANEVCIYGHYVGDRLIYIGMGRLDRVFNIKCRSDEWKRLTKDGYRVALLAWFGDRAAARTEEKRLIREFSPICNLLHSANWVSPHIGNTYSVGRKHTEESKKKLSESQKASWRRTKRLTGRRTPIRPIKCLNTGIVYSGLREAARQTGAHFTCISQCINGSRISARGLRFARMEDLPCS